MVAEPRREPGRSEPNQSGTAGEGGGHGFTPAGGAGYGQHRDPGLRRAGAERLQRPLRVHLLSPAAAVQSGRRLPGGQAASGNVHSAEGWEELLLPEIERQQELGKEVVFRADAAFAKPEIYEALEERGVKYAIRLPANDSLERDIEELLTRPVGRPSHKPIVWYKGFLYQAASWKTARRVVAKVEFHAGELFPSGLHRDESGDTEPGGGALLLLQQARHGGAVDQGRQASGEDDAADLVTASGPTRCGCG